MSLKNFPDLTEREILAVAIASEEEDSRIYTSFAEDLRGALSARPPGLPARWPTRRTAIAATCWKSIRSGSAPTCRHPPRGRQGLLAAAGRSG